MPDESQPARGFAGSGFAGSEGLAARLREAGVEAKVVPAEGKTHATINRELGQPDDASTKAVFEFLRARGTTPVTRPE